MSTCDNVNVKVLHRVNEQIRHFVHNSYCLKYISEQGFKNCDRKTYQFPSGTTSLTVSLCGLRADSSFQRSCMRGLFASLTTACSILCSRSFSLLARFSWTANFITQTHTISLRSFRLEAKATNHFNGLLSAIISSIVLALLKNGL